MTNVLEYADRNFNMNIKTVGKHLVEVLEEPISDPMYKLGLNLLVLDLVGEVYVSGDLPRSLCSWFLFISFTVAVIPC